MQLIKRVMLKMRVSIAPTLLVKWCEVREPAMVTKPDRAIGNTIHRAHSTKDDDQKTGTSIKLQIPENISGRWLSVYGSRQITLFISSI